MAQLRLPSGKFASKDEISKMSKEDYEKLVQFNIEKYGYKVEEKIESKENEEVQVNNIDAEEEKPKFPKHVTFGASFYKQKISMRTADYKTEEAGRVIEFSEGKYTTSDPEEIKFLKNETKRPGACYRITVVEEVY